MGAASVGVLSSLGGELLGIGVAAAVAVVVRELSGIGVAAAVAVVVVLIMA